MFTATFIFKKKQFDEAFHALDNQIADFAKSIPGYLGETTWENTDTGQVSTTYYWENEAALAELMSHPIHLAAKQRQGEWLDGYQVEISQLLGSYGDGKLHHPLRNHPIPYRKD